MKQDLRYAYYAYGLKVESKFYLPELQIVEDKNKPDVTIKNRIVPITLKNPLEYGVRFEASKNNFLLKVDNISKLYAANDNDIIIEPSQGSKEKDIRLFLLSTVFAALLHQRKHIVLHSNCTEVNEHGFIFLGASVTSKSTLAAGFYKKGYKFLAD